MTHKRKTYTNLYGKLKSSGILELNSVELDYNYGRTKLSLKFVYALKFLTCVKIITRLTRFYRAILHAFCGRSADD